MARKNKNILLDTLTDTFGQSADGNSTTNMDTIESVIDAPNIDNLDDTDNTPADNNAAEGVVNNKPADNNDNSNIPQDVPNRMNNSSIDDASADNDDVQTVDDSNTDSGEAQQIGAFFDAFAEALNWDVAEEDKPQSIDGLINYIEDVVEQNSKPTYADDRIAQLDQFVKNGGSFEDFYGNMSQTVSYDNMDMEDESNQKAVVRDYMRMQGFSDEQINNKIERYDDAGLLEEEANDAVLRLKQIRQQELEMQQAQQEEYARIQEEQARQFSKDLVSNINGLTSIRGMAVPKEDRRALFDYITRTDADGLTQYQKDFNKNQVQNLIESAYFTMKGDALLGEAKRSGETTAAQKLRTMLRHQAKNHTTYNVQENNKSALEIASKLFR